MQLLFKEKKYYYVYGEIHAEAQLGPYHQAVYVPRSRMHRPPKKRDDRGKGKEEAFIFSQ